MRHQLAGAGDECRIGLFLSVDEDLHCAVLHPEVALPTLRLDVADQRAERRIPPHVPARSAHDQVSVGRHFVQMKQTIKA